MGLLRAGVGAAASVLSDQWRDYFYCDAIPSDVLVVKARSRSGGTDNIISDGSIIAVNEGQCMLIVHQGAIVEVCADPGQFVFEGEGELKRAPRFAVSMRLFFNGNFIEITGSIC